MCIIVADPFVDTHVCASMVEASRCSVHDTRLVPIWSIEKEV